MIDTAMLNGMLKGKVEGKIEGKIEGKTEVILALHADGITYPQIAKYTKLTEDEVIRILTEKGQMK